MNNLLKGCIVSLLFTILVLGSDHLITKEFSVFNSGLFFLFTLYVTLFFRPYQLIYLLLILFGAIHYLFFSYFQRSVTSTDIYLFFTHTEETFESFYSLYPLFILAFSLTILALLFLWKLKKITIESYALKVWIKYPILLLLAVFSLNSSMGMQFVDAVSKLSFEKPKRLIIKESPLYPRREANFNIVLLLGESMKYNAYVESKLKAQNFFYKKIYSGATNTDVAIPLLLNTKTNTLELSHKNETNLFRLAKKNYFTNTFVSVQSEKSLKYIKPYLQTEHIDYYKSHTTEEQKPNFDLLLLNTLRKTDFSKNNFIVFQQIGQHSPYMYFKAEPSQDPAENYNRSVDYSFRLYEQIHKELIAIQKPFIFIYVSDHGEFTGENGRYGHNSFDSVIYEVPMFITSNIDLPKAYKGIRSQHHLSQFITYLLGYKKQLELSKEKSIVNGTMLSREDGFISIE